MRLLILCFVFLPTLAHAQTWHAPFFLFGERAGRFDQASTYPQPDNSLPEQVLFTCPDGAGGAFVLLNLKLDGHLVGLPDVYRHPGTYLGRIDYLGRFAWARIVNLGGEYQDAHQRAFSGMAADGHGNALLWGQNQDSSTFDGQSLFEPLTYTVRHGNSKGLVPFMMSFSDSGRCNWTRQIGSGNVYSDFNMTVATVPDTSGIWMACHYMNLDFNALNTPFVLPADSFGVAFVHLRLPGGEVDRFRTLPADCEWITRRPPNFVYEGKIASDGQGSLYWQSQAYNTALILDSAVVATPRNSYQTFLAKIDASNRWSLVKLLPNLPSESYVAGLDFNPRSRRLRQRIIYQDSLVLTGIGTIRNPPSRWLTTGQAIGEMDTLGRWVWANRMVTFGPPAGERVTSNGRELIWTSPVYDFLRDPGLADHCAAYGPDTVCRDTTQPHSSLVVYATDTTGSQYRWAIVGGGSVVSVSDGGTIMTGPTLLVGGVGDTSVNNPVQASFAGPGMPAPSKRTPCS